jgi:hypothetical protein
VALDAQECLQVPIAFILGVVVRLQLDSWVFEEATQVLPLEIVIFDYAQVTDCKFPDLVQLVVNALIEPVRAAFENVFAFKKANHFQNGRVRDYGFCGSFDCECFNHFFVFK